MNTTLRIPQPETVTISHNWACALWELAETQGDLLRTLIRKMEGEVDDLNPLIHALRLAEATATTIEQHMAGAVETAELMEEAPDEQ